MDLYDVIVVGAGIEGSATAYHLAKQGKHTLLLEQFPLPHSRGSSHGQTRITRRSYGPKHFYSKMMAEAYSLTEILERECGEKLFVNCGLLTFGSKDSTYLVDSRDALKSLNVPHETLSAIELRRRFPMMSLPDGYEGLIDKSGGILRADKMLKALQNQFIRYGGTVKDGQKMLDLYPGDVVVIKTDDNEYKGKSVVLALGPWSSSFLPRIGVHVPLEPIKVTVCYWKDKHGDFSVRKCPTFHGYLDGRHIYGLPADDYPGLVKICLHDGPRIDPDQRDDVDNRWVLNTMTDIIARHFPTLEAHPYIIESCIYTNTPDTDFILDVHPSWKNVVVAAGFSGHGFKLAPVVGKVLAQLATGSQPSYDLSHFKINRFFKNKL